MPKIAEYTDCLALKMLGLDLFSHRIPPVPEREGKLFSRVGAAAAPTVLPSFV
jgi:hypothetical protein